MNSLNELIGQTIFAEFEFSDEFIYIKGIVTHINIEDFYFHEKREPIYISVDIEPLEELPEYFDYELLNEIPLANILAY